MIRRPIIVDIISSTTTFQRCGGMTSSCGTPLMVVSNAVRIPIFVFSIQFQSKSFQSFYDHGFLYIIESSFYGRAWSANSVDWPFV